MAALTWGIVLSFALSSILVLVTANNITENDNDSSKKINSINSESLPLEQQKIRAGERKRPHIILIIADDLGFNDVSFHGSSQIPTPNIDALAYSGIVLNSYYVSPICTPSRSALFSGKHPIHTGMQHDVIFGATPYGLPLTEKILPEYLKDFGYATHLVGKWHLGHFRTTYTPICRGYDSHYGHWTGHKDYYDNMAEESNPEAWGYDMRRDFETTHENFGQYTTDLYTNEAKSIIERHDKTTPLFLTVSHTAVHSANPYQLLQAPEDVVANFSYITNKPRRKYAAMVKKLDLSIGEVVSSLASKGMLSESIIIFTTDNGGPAAGFNGNAASNWPLRGVKNTLWEGGVRGVGLIWSPFLNSTSRISNRLIHIQDWLPTLMGAMGEDPAILGDIDGINLWDSISLDQESPRTEILHNIDDIYGNEAVRVGNWKLLHGTTYSGRWDGWYGPSGRIDEVTATNEAQIDNEKLQLELEVEAQSLVPVPQLLNKIRSSSAALAIQQLGLFPSDSVITEMQQNAGVECLTSPAQNITSCNLLSGQYCLYNIIEDPCEFNNVANYESSVLQELKDTLERYRQSAVPLRNKPKDPRGHPKHWSYSWTNWMDFVEPIPSTNSNSNNSKCS